MNEHRPPHTTVCDGFAMRFDKDGGFVCGSLKTNRTAYAYPTSESAKHAWAERGDAHDMARIAKQMIDDVHPTHAEHIARAYDARNWQTLGMPLPELVEG